MLRCCDCQIWTDAGSPGLGSPCGSDKLLHRPGDDRPQKGSLWRSPADSSWPVSAACPACAAAVGVARAEDAHWSYADPQDWGADGASRACSVGGEQSPINLTDGVRAEIEPPAVSWRAEAFSVVNDGHAIQANASPGGFATSAGRK